MNDEWEEILDDYNQAKAALWCPKDAQNWHRDEETGMYYMWSAYMRARKVTTPGDYLLLARVFAMVADQASIFDMERYEKYIKPAVDAYELAIQAGQKPTEDELLKMRYAKERALHDKKRLSTPYEEHVKRIQGHEKLRECGFQFLGSVPVWFEKIPYTARLKLKSGNASVTFLFEDIHEFDTTGDVPMGQVSEFYCYPHCWHEEILEFHVDFYDISCTSISVESVEIDDVGNA